MRVDFSFKNKTYKFETKAGLFSNERVDNGSILLLQNIKVKENDIVIDLGCGYGTIGLVLSDQTPQGKVYLVDTDIRAVKYLKINAKLNNINNVKVFSSDGFENVDETVKFNVVVSNPPTHMPKETIIDFIEGAKKRLLTGGKLYFVTEKRVKPMIQREFMRVLGNYELVKSNSSHSISLAYKE